ncbi:hypothetical protein [Bacillus sp. RO1]|uniref:hypothetical protein n=1 Tax=Bacillus sp. RO1 TaxID=2722703 RepID=UPI0014575524|nr:hypothetical protein [Bacillus sp. RO1]NLP50237.1 hypothetical protein [Bacillus sp. RO1]
MNKALPCLSFLKQNKISYYYDEEKNEILFPCFTCKNQAEMSTITTMWQCNKCKTKGNLVTLIKELKEKNTIEIKEVKIYNPTKENREVRNLIKQIDERYQSKETSRLRNKIEQLLNYYSEKSS